MEIYRNICKKKEMYILGVTWCKGSCFKANAEVAKQVMDELAAEGKLSPAELVEVSRPKTAPLHKDFFDLNDKQAAQKYREERAANMIRSIIVTPDDEQEVKPVRAFFNIERGTREYIPTEIIFSDEAKKSRLLEIAKRELISFKVKYETLTELAGVINAIDELLREETA